MKKMMKKCWLMLAMLAVGVSPLLTSCSDDDDNGGENVPYLKVNGGNVDFAIDQAEATIASIEANNTVTVSKKPSWIKNVEVKKNPDGTYSAVITRDMQNDTEKRSDSIVFAASTVSAGVAVVCDGQQLDAAYTVAKLEKPADGFFGEKSFTFSVLRKSSTLQDTVLAFIKDGRSYWPAPAERIEISKSSVAPAEAINTSYYSVKVADLKDQFEGAVGTYYFFVMSEGTVENFVPNTATPAFILTQYNSGLPLISLVADNFLEITPGTAQDITIMYNNKIVNELQVVGIEGWLEAWEEDPLGSTTLVPEITITKKSSTANGDYTTAVYTVNAQPFESGKIVVLAKDASGQYVRDENDGCYSVEIDCMVISE